MSPTANDIGGPNYVAGLYLLGFVRSFGFSPDQCFQVHSFKEAEFETPTSDKTIQYYLFAKMTVPQ